MKGVAVAMALLVVPAAARAADAQFDLICTGFMKSAVGEAGTPTTRRYRIDLESNRWCFDSCAQPREFFSVGADLIVMDKFPVTADLIYAKRKHFVNRQSGAVMDHDDIGLGFAGSCEKAPFTPLPAPKF